MLTKGSWGGPGLLALALVGALLSALRYVPVIDEPWDRSVESLSSAGYFGRAEQYFQRLGFLELRGCPYFYRLPAVEGVAAPELIHGRYVRHPVLAFWLVHLSVEAGGWSERAFRIVPIVFSSLTGALLAFLIGRYAGPGWALAGLALYLTVPMSWVVGWMVSYEPCAIAMVVAGFVAHLLLRDATPRAYSLVWTLVFIAGLFDWSALFVVAAIFVYELLLPASRRLRRALWLAIPALLAVVTFAALGSLWRGSFAGGWIMIWENARHAALHEARKGPTGEWLANQWKFWRDLYTLPLTLVVLAAIPLLVARCRSATDPLPRSALALLVPALLHVVVFRDHSFDHEFWWCYATPFAVLSAVVLVREAASRARISFGHPAVMPAILVLLLAWGGIDRIRRRHEAIRTDEYRDLGAELNRFANPEDALLFPGMFESESFYLKPWYLERIGSASLDEYRGMRDYLRAGKLLVRRVVGVVPDGTAVDFTEANLPALREIGSVRRIGAAELLAQAPTLAARFPGRGLWVLTIE